MEAIKLKYKSRINTDFCSKSETKNISYKLEVEGSDVVCTIYDSFMYENVVKPLKQMFPNFVLPVSTKYLILSETESFTDTGKKDKIKIPGMVMFVGKAKCHPEEKQFNLKQGVQIAKERALGLRSDFFHKMLKIYVDDCFKTDLVISKTIKKRSFKIKK